MSTRYVQHISGQGEKWELDSPYVEGGSAFSWCVRGKAGGHLLFVPKSEYRLCDPPERWEQIDNTMYIQVCVVDKEGFALPGQFRARVPYIERKVQ